MEYFTNVRLYRLDAKGKKAVAAANTVIFDMDEDEAEMPLAKGYIRKATVGEVAEARASAKPAKPEAKKSTKKAVEPEDKKVIGADDKKPDELA